MSRIRSIKPEFWTSEQVLELSIPARLVFIGMWNFCDDGGNHPASAKTLKAETLPADDVTVAEVQGYVDEMIAQGLVVEYESNSRKYWHVTGFLAHQNPKYPSIKHPEFRKRSGNVPETLPEDSGNVPETLPEDSGNVPETLPEDSGNVPETLPEGEENVYGEENKTIGTQPPKEKINVGGVPESVSALCASARTHAPARGEPPDAPPSAPPLPGESVPGEISTKSERNGTRLPGDWGLPDPWRLWATSEFGLDDAKVGEIADCFADYWRGKAGKDARKADWQATWRNWVRRECKGGYSRAPPAFSTDERDRANADIEVQQILSGV